MAPPYRLVVDFNDTSYGWRKTPLSVDSDPLKQIRGSQYKRGVARVVVELTRNVGYAIREESNGLAIVIPTADTARGAAPGDTDKPAPKATAAPAAAPPRPGPPSRQVLPGGGVGRRADPPGVRPVPSPLPPAPPLRLRVPLR